MKFVNFVKYSDLGKIAGARHAHFAYADRLREGGKLAVGGPLTDDQGRRIGLLFIYEAGSRDEALRFAEEDPFTVAGALSSSEISEWRPRFVSSDLLVQAHRAAHQDGAGRNSRLFANYVRYVTDIALLTAVRPAHWEYDRTLESGGTLALAGPFADGTGGLFVYSARSRDKAMFYLEQDPFARERVFAKCELLEWLIEGVNPELLTVAKTKTTGAGVRTLV